MRQAIVSVGKKLAAAQLACARSGNVSLRRDKKTVLITATGAALGDLRPGDIVRVCLATGEISGAKRPSSELPLHLAIYKNFDCRAVIHCHPPLANAFFAVHSRLPVLTFETRFYLKDVPVIRQRSLNVSDPAPVVAALAGNKLAVLRNHGVVAIGQDFTDTLELIQILEESVKIACIARLFRKKSLDGIDRAIKTCLRPHTPIL